MLFTVIEYSSFFAVRHNPTGDEHPMGDGADTLFTEDGSGRVVRRTSGTVLRPAGRSQMPGRRDLGGTLRRAYKEIGGHSGKQDGQWLWGLAGQDGHEGCH